METYKQLEKNKAKKAKKVKKAKIYEDGEDVDDNERIYRPEDEENRAKELGEEFGSKTKNKKTK